MTNYVLHECCRCTLHCSKGSGAPSIAGPARYEMCEVNMVVQACCQPYHTAEELPQTAEVLMRARFSAYVKRDADFLVSACAPSGN